MCRPITLVFLLLIFFFHLTSTEGKPEAGEAVFYGIVQAVDLGNKTFTLKASGRSYVFHYNEQTKISRYSGYVKWSMVKPGEGATVLMRVGEGNAGIALQVRFTIDNGRAEEMALYAARTTKGEVVSGAAVGNFILSEPVADSFSGSSFFGGAKFGAKAGVFHLVLRPDGSVAQVTAAKSLGDDEMNLRAANWLRKWKFRPNSLSEAQIPISIIWRAY